MTFRVAVLDDYGDIAAGLPDWKGLGSGVEVTFFSEHVADEDELAGRLEYCDGIVIMRERTQCSRRLLSRLPRLRLIVTTAMGNAAIDMEAARALGITVSGTDTVQGMAAAMAATREHIWGLVLSLARGIPSEDAAIRHGGWQVGLGSLLCGKTFGVVGLGTLGAMTVPIAKAFDMRVVAWSKNLSQARAAQIDVERVEREEFFATCDVISVHIKLSERSRGYVGRDDLRLMKRTAFLVNTSRGPVVEEAALLEALSNRWIAGAALDVFDSEPLPSGHPFRQMPNTVLTPHVGYVSTEFFGAHFPQIVEDIRDYIAGNPIRVLTAT